MPYRWTHLRKVDQNGSTDVSGDWPISLFRAALSAAEETIQGSPFASAWLRLFQEHLSTSEPEMLRWRGSLGTSAETRRAYSGLYGRYFARALLAGELGITDFISLKTNRTSISGGVTVGRVRTGDIPDWIAWDPRGQGYVLGEAKGRISGSLQDYLTGVPSCIRAGKEQFTRVVVRDSGNRSISTRNWVVVNRWSTDERGGQAVSLLWDPPGGGEPLGEEEARRHAEAIRRYRIGAIARRLGDPEFMVRIVAEGSVGDLPSLTTDAKRESLFDAFERPSREPHEGYYQAAIVTPLGIRAIRNESDLDEARAIGDRARRTDEPAMVFGCAQGSFKTAESEEVPWLSENGIASADGSALFNLGSVEMGRA